MTQKSVVLAMLKEAGSKGVDVHELIYKRGITRAAAIVYELKEEGYNIATVPGETLADGRTRLARYILPDYAKPRPVAPPTTGFFDEDPLPLKPITWDCGCVRAADGRSWEKRCDEHSGKMVREEATW